MKVRDLIEELSKRDPEAEVVHTSGLGWPTFNPFQSTMTTRIKLARHGSRFPYWFEKVDDLDEPDTIKAVVLY